jgi:hypothetical protein
MFLFKEWICPVSICILLIYCNTYEPCNNFPSQLLQTACNFLIFQLIGQTFCRLSVCLWTSLNPNICITCNACVTWTAYIPVGPRIRLVFIVQMCIGYCHHTHLAKVSFSFCKFSLCCYFHETILILIETASMSVVRQIPTHIIK